MNSLGLELTFVRSAYVVGYKIDGTVRQNKVAINFITTRN